MSCPYDLQPDDAWWHKQHKANIQDTQISTKFKLKSTDKVATAGSCFAQRISSELANQGFNYYCTEPAPIFLPGNLHSKYHYKVFSARYGNIYTTAQLWQLWQRAFSLASFDEPIWENEKGKFVDAFRPFVQPGGFDSHEQLLSDRKLHLSSVREMFEHADVFVFTLGLTEYWYSNVSKAILPACPGCKVGQYSESYSFKNLDFKECHESLDNFILALNQLNPACKVILTVSPVPLVATMGKEGAIRATTYSKSLLRIVAEEMYKKWSHVDYFSSYEVFQSCFKQSEYYADNRRNVTSEGVYHVMSLFLKHYCNITYSSTSPVLNDSSNNAEDGAITITSELSAEAKEVCDEELLYERMAESER